MTPIAGRPPFATEDPDSIFEDQPKAAPRPSKQNVDTTAPGGPRESAYTAFDSYFTGNGPDPRASGVGDIGRGLMNAGSDYDDSSDEEAPIKKHTQATTEQHSDKHRVLYTAATGTPPSDPPRPSHGSAPGASHEQEPQKQPANIRVVQQPQPVVHARSNDWHKSQHLEPSTPPGTAARSMAQQQRAPPLALQAGGRPVAAPAPAHSRPQVAFMQGQVPGIGQPNLNSQGSPYFTGAMPGNPSPTARTPQPLPPPQTPIMPVFARPRKESNAVKFDEKGEILRGNSEETLLPRGVGGKGDEFWRRFSMVAKEDARAGSKKSAWLRKTESGTTRMATWVWLVGILFLAAIGGGIGVGWYFTHNKPASQPVAIGGSADEGFTSTSSTSAGGATFSTRPTKVTAAPVPTNTANNNNKRGDTLVPSAPTPAPDVYAIPSVPAAHRKSLVNRVPH